MGHGTGEEEAEHEHDAEYSNHNSNAAAYHANRGPYEYNAGPATTGTSLTGEHPHLSPEMTGSPNNRNTSAQGTPRTNASSQQQQQPQWTQGYHTPPRTQSSSSNLYNVMSNDQRGNVATNGTSGSDGYGGQPGLGGVLPTAGYPSQQSSLINGAGSSSNKRVREIDDDGSRGSRDVSVSRGPSSPGEGLAGMKRRKTIRENSLPGVGATGMASAMYDRDPAGGLNRSRSAIVQRH